LAITVKCSQYAKLDRISTIETIMPIWKNMVLDLSNHVKIINPQISVINDVVVLTVAENQVTLD